MTPEQWRHVTAVFDQALGCEPARRRAFLDDACGVDGMVRQEVERLLAAHEAASRFGELAVARSALATDPVTGTAVDGSDAEPATHSARRPRDPFLAIVWLLAAITAGAFTYAASLFFVNGGRYPDVGWFERRDGGRWFVAAVVADGPAAGRLQQGDEFFEFNGAPPFAILGTQLHRRPLSAGDTYTISIERGGERQSMRLDVGARRPPLLSTLTYYVSSLVWCLIGLWIGASRPEHPIGRLAACVSVAVGLVFLFIGVIADIAYWAPLHTVLGYHFFVRFPTGAPARKGWKLAQWTLYATAITSGLAGIAFEGVVFVRGFADAARFDWLAQVREALGVLGFTGAVVGMVAVVPRNYRLLTTDDQRRRVQWVIYAALLAMGPEVWYSIVALYETFVGPTRISKLTFVANILPVVIPISVAYVVVKHQVLDISIVVRRTVQYLLARRVLQAAVAVPLIGLGYTVVRQRHLTVVELLGNTSAYLYWLAAAGAALRFRRPIELWLDRRFFREQYDREQLLLGLLDDVRKVDSISDLSRLVNERLESALHPTRAFVWYRDPAELAAASSSNPVLAPADVPASERWLQWLEQRGAATRLPLPPGAPATRAESQWFAERGISLIVPIMDSDDRLVGALLVGEKKSQEAYTPADQQLLGAIAKQAAVVRENLRLRARVNDEVRVRHDVLARLGERISDLLKECPACGACYEGPIERCERDGKLLTLTLPVARTIDAKYRLDQLLGKGGMGAVYEASDLRLERAVAVKIMLGRAFGQQTALRRFHREARAAARLNHPNIVAVYDVGFLEGEGAYLVMERLHGTTLRAELDRQRPMPAALAADWFGPVLDGVAAAHQAGIIHRDLKPENIMGHRADSGMLAVKILDLGLVKFRGDHHQATLSKTAAGLVMGTIGYMSPEQLLGQPVDERTDIYAIGVMLVETLTGRRPFQTDASELADPRLRPPYRLDGSSARAHALDAVLKRCLSADARDRYPAAADLRAELMPLLRVLTPDDLAAS